jgi:hypothetical protein
MIICMNVKRLLILFATFSLFAFMPGDKTVLAASPDLANGHFQLQAVIVDDSTNTPVHRLFLVDTDTGKVWRYQPVFTQADANGAPKVIAAESFVPVPVVQSKP